MIGLVYSRVLQMKYSNPHFSKNPYARIKEWKIFRKRVLSSKKKYDRKKLKLDTRKEDR